VEALQVGTLGYKRHIIGNFKGAIPYYQRALESDPNLAPTYEGLGAAYYVVGVIGALAHLQIARAQKMMGDEASARKWYEDFLNLWKDADPDLPIYRQAKAEYAKLRK
jgi:tetratricopeptide (TPR) repeat protein